MTKKTSRRQEPVDADVRRRVGRLWLGPVLQDPNERIDRGLARRLGHLPTDATGEQAAVAVAPVRVLDAAEAGHPVQHPQQPAQRARPILAPTPRNAPPQPNQSSLSSPA
jgi:hypothetical protein